MRVTDPISARLYIHHHDFDEERRVPRHQRHHLKLSPSRDGLKLDSAISHRFIVLTTIESYIEQIVRLFAHLNGRSGAVSAAGVTFPRSHDGIAWARVVRDEAHLTVNYDTQFFRIMGSLIARPYQSPNLLALTATPILRQGVADVLALIRTINDLSPNLSSDARYTDFTTIAGLEGLCRDQTALRIRQREGSQNNPDDLQRKVADSTGRLLTSYCIRRRNSSVQNGKSLALIPPISYLDVTCPTPDTTCTLRLQRVEWLLKKQLTPEFKNAKRLYAQQHPGKEMENIEIGMFLDNASMPRILATLPHLAEAQDRRAFMWASIAQRDWYLRPEESDIATHLQLHIGSSGKLQRLQQITQGLGYDVNGRPEKLVVVSEFPIVCLAVLVVRIFPLHLYSIY